MICVSIGRGRQKLILVEHQHMVEQGAELVELRLDYIIGKINIKQLLANRPGPVLFACRRENDGGRYEGTEEDRILLLRSAIAEGVDYIDLEDDIAASIPRFGKTKRVISHHDFQKTPENLQELHQRLRDLDADIVKIAAIANQPSDNWRMMKLVQESDIPTVGICMGDIGLPTRILAPKFGCPFTYATFHHERRLAPGQISYQQMLTDYNYNTTKSDTEVYGVIADPVGHSLSPRIHNPAFKHEGLNKVYVPFRVPSEYLSEFIDSAPKHDIRGLSVTIPHKEAVLEKLTDMDDSVREIGAANTLIFKEGRIYGYNTDCQAAMESLQIAFTKDTELENSTALILGAGGVAKAIVYELRNRGVHVVIASRTFERAEKLAKRFDAKAIQWDNRHATNSHYLINCTPIGMHPNVNESPFEKHYLKPTMIIFDTVYNPENTLLIKYAKEQSCKVVTGLEMFVRQAALQFKLFTGVDAPSDLMLQSIRQAIGPVKY